MTKTTIERLAVVESKQDRANSDISEIKANQAHNHEDLSSRFDVLSQAIHTRLGNHEERIKSAEETLEPFTKFKRRLWGAVVTSLLTIAFVAIVLLESQRIK